MQTLKNVLLMIVLALSGFISFLLASERTPASISLGIGIMAIAFNLILVGTDSDYKRLTRIPEAIGESYWKGLRRYAQARPVRGRIAQLLLFIGVASLPTAHFLR